MNWEETKEQLKTAVDSSEYNLWIKPIECAKVEDHKLHLSCPDRYFSAFVSRKYLGLIQEKAREITGKPYQVSLDGDKGCPKKNGPRPMMLPGMPSGGSRIRNLHPRYTFDEFMVGESNILAQSACKAVSSRDESVSPCLFMNAGTGLGKSHLTHAVAHQVLAEMPFTRLHYLTARQFSAEMVKGIMNQQIEEFKQKYQEHCDILLLEDVHTLAGKKKTQEELNGLVDAMIKSGKRVIFTAKHAPHELDGIDGELCSRMTNGLVTAIKAPDLTTRKRIVASKAAQQTLELEEEFIELLAGNIKGDVRKIESAVAALKVRANLDGVIDKQLVQEIVSSVAGVVTALTPAVICEFISSQFKVSVKDLQSKSRKRKITYPRQLAMYLSRKYTSDSLADIGRVFNRDHSTVLYSIRVISDLARRDQSASAQLDLLNQKVQQL
ncbi:MAG: chromosomal replication initiator protein DnaA [Deltaproteobacteria bacterium]|nr:MAG: chromosomal replication initiator protein DnaA [Deltaproteobacteria bacterium]